MMSAASSPCTARLRASSTSALVMMCDPMSVETAVPPTTTMVKAAVMRVRSEIRPRRQ
jgi:hypothetical protein